MRGPGRRLRRALVAIVGAVVVVAVLVIGVGWWVRGRVEDSLARNIERRLPGTEVHVEVASFPFLVHLAASGTILAVSAHLSRVSAGRLVFNGVHLEPVTFRDVDIHVDDLVVDRGQLLHRRAVLEHIRKATITATVDQGSLDKSIGLPISLGEGTVGVGGLTLPATVAIEHRQVTVTVPGEIRVSFDAPPLQALPCIGAVAIVTGALQLSCTLDHLPPALPATAFDF